MQLTGRDRLKGLGSGLIFLGYWAIRGIDVDALPLAGNGFWDGGGFTDNRSKGVGGSIRILCGLGIPDYRSLLHWREAGFPSINGRATKPGLNFLI